MRNSSSAMRLMLLFLLLSSICLPVLRLYAQEYVVTVGALSPGAIKGPQQGGLMQQLRYSIPLTFSPQQVNEILQQRPGSITVSFPSILPLPAMITLRSFEIFTPGLGRTVAPLLVTKRTRFGMNGFRLEERFRVTRTRFL